MEMIIRPRASTIHILEDIWRYRELFYFLAWRDIKVRYKQTILGIVWALLQPLVTMIVFTIFFHNVVHISSGNIPYPVFAYSGLLFWNYFSSTLSDVSNSMITNQSIITKVFFPRIIIPISTTIVGLVDFGVAFVFLIVLMLFYHIYPDPLGMLVTILCLGVTILSLWGIGIFLSVLNVRYRDVRYALPFFIQLLLFVTPVIYPVSLAPKEFHTLFYLNPMTGVIELARSAILHMGTMNWTGFGISIISSIVFLGGSLLYFNHYERELADII